MPACFDGESVSDKVYARYSKLCAEELELRKADIQAFVDAAYADVLARAIVRWSAEYPDAARAEREPARRGGS